MSASIYIVGEAWGAQEAIAAAPFVGPSGQVLDSLLSQNGLRRRDILAIDNVFNFQPPNNDLESLMTKEKSLASALLPRWKPGWFLRKEHEPHVVALRARIERAKPNIVLALGNTPLWALTVNSGIGSWRGFPMLCSFAPIKLLATWHPAAILRQWNLRPIAFMDIAKAIAEASYPDLRRPQREILIEPTLAEIEAFYHSDIAPAPYISCDIETKKNTITEVGFAPSPSRAIVIPFYSRAQTDGNFWRTQADELAAWAWVRRVCAEKPLIGQNFQYDITFLLRTMGIPCPNILGDTMIEHHSLQPEMKKGLGFLGSIYTKEPQWKLMRERGSRSDE